MDQKQEALLGLPLTNAEREWLTDRLETLSVKESYQLSAAIMRSGRLQELMGKSREELQVTVLRMKPDVAVEAINCLMTLHDYEVCYQNHRNAAENDRWAAGGHSRLESLSRGMLRHGWWERWLSPLFRGLAAKENCCNSSSNCFPQIYRIILNRLAEAVRSFWKCVPAQRGEMFTTTSTVT